VKVLDDPAPDVIVNGLGDNSVNLTLRAWVNTSDFADTRSGLYEAVHREFGKAGISIPYPQRDIHLVLPKGFSLPAQVTGEGAKSPG
jgi:small conductance mechanosensitive channel